MSKYIDIIRLVDGYRPNSLEDHLKLWWLVTLDGKIAVELMRMDQTTVREMMDCEYPAGLEHEPLIGFPHEEMYLHYLEAKICYTEGEYSDYQNAMECFNAAYSSYAEWFLNNHDPVQGYVSEEVGM
jgi:hypothetical protein